MNEPIYVSVGRSEGLILRIATHPIGGKSREIELSYEEWGRVLAGLGGCGYERQS